MNNFGYTPNQVAEMTIEQQILGFKELKDAGRTIHFTSLGEARKFLQDLKNAKS